MADQSPSRLALVESRLDSIRQDETRGYWRWYRWLAYTVLVGLVTLVAVLLLRRTSLALFSLSLGLVAVFATFIRAVVLIAVWWPLGTEKSRLLREKRQLRGPNSQC